MKKIIKEINPEFINQLPGLPKDFLSILKFAAKKSGVKRVAIVGGVIRDKIIHSIHKVPLQKYQDIDLLVEGFDLEINALFEVIYLHNALAI